jgi:D-alanyl-D-alanine carboxypeptidase/D-alanyl-D-alanine-endopeptidase (penicillin-binding protein 4)
VTGEVRTNAVPQRFELAVSDPAAWFLDRLRKKLNESGVPVGGEDFVTGSMEGFSDWKILGEIQSPPMHEMISIMLKESQNLYAETLFRFTGEKMRQNLTGNFTSEQSAVLNMTDWLIARGINRAELRVEDGSGLSRGTLSSAHALVTLLRWSREWEHHSLFRSLLPVAGVDGTLRNRFIGSRLSRKLWAKTGSLNGVATLSGFMEGVQGDPLVFSVLLNNYQPKQGKNAREVVDELVELLSHWEPPK